MAAILKATAGIDSRWTECLQRHFPFHDVELADHLLAVLAYVAAGAPRVWTETESKGTKGCKTSPIERIHVVQKRFERHEGELASVVCVFKSWEKVAKRERLRWCRRSHVNNASMSQVQEMLIRLRGEVHKMGRRKSLRSAEGATSTLNDGNVIGRLAGLLVKVFADCYYQRWNAGDTYLNMVLATTRLMDFGDKGLYDAFKVELPVHILYLPNVTSRAGEDDFNPTTEVCVSLVIPEDIAHTACITVPLLIKNNGKVHLYASVTVALPSMGDAVVLLLAGNRTALEQLRNDIREACSTGDDMLLDIRVHEPNAAGSRWRLAINCSEMHQKKIENLMREKVRVTMDHLETEVGLLPFPDVESSLRLLVGGGAQVQEVQSNQHPVLIYFIRCVEHDHAKPGKKTDSDLTEDVVRTHLEQYGKIVEIQKSGRFPTESLWGMVRFEFLSSALKASKLANGVTLLGQFEMLVVHIENDCQVYKLDFHWRRSTLVRNRLQMYFLNEEDLNKFKRQKLHYEFKREYDDDELKAIITTEDTYSNLPDHTSMMSDISVYPKFTTYNHHVIYEAAEADIPKVKEQLQQRMTESFTDPDLIEITFETPKPGGSILTGTFNSYSVHRLMRLEDHIGYYEGSNLLAGGEMVTDRRVHMNFTLPKEAFKKLEPELKTINKKQRYSRSESEDSVAGEQNQAADSPAGSVGGNNSRMSYIQVKPEGESLNVTIYGDHYFTRIGHELKVIPKLMKPHIMHVRGDLLAALLATSSDKQQPNVVGIMDATDTFIQIMKRNSLVHIYGPQKNVTDAREQIRQFLVKPHAQVSASKTPQRPGGSRHNRCRQVVTPPSGSQHAECPVCLCDVQGVSFTLSLCGHMYCSECLRDLVDACRSVRNFPIRCVLASCNRVLLNVDVEQICANYAMPLMKVLTASMQAFQRNNVARVYPCITPDCEMVYRMCTSKMEGMVRSFACPLCKVTLCTYCHCAYHVGLSCTVFKAMQTVDNKVKAWMEENKDFRKLCPNCKTGIEKVDGCDHLHCTACKAEICWVCLQFFTDPRKMSYHRCSGEDAASDTESEAEME